MRLSIFNVKLDMLVVGEDGRKYRAIDREISPVACGVRRPWVRLHLQDLESGAVNVVEFHVPTEVDAEWPTEVE